MAQSETLVEKRAIEFVPEAERHGKIYSLGMLFFSGNMMMVSVATGIVPVTLGLNLRWSIIAIVVGNLLGGCVASLHAVQGPRIGIPQMIQSRAQFGVLGANLPLVLAVLMYLGLFAGGAILGGEAISAIFGVSTAWAIIITNVLTFILFAFGHDVIHRAGRWLSVLFTVIFVIATILVVEKAVALPVGAAAGKFTVSTFLISLSIFVAWQITYGPYVADYSRYLPRNTRSSSVFLSMYIGNVLGSVWSQIIGAILAVVAAKLAADNPTLAFTQLFGTSQGIRVIILLAALLGIVIINALNIYGGTLSSLSVLSSAGSLAERALNHGRWYRLTVGLAFVIVATVISIAGSGAIIAFVDNLLTILVYVFIPWSAINLSDFFLIERGEYVLSDIYDKNGVYGAWGWPALVAFFVAIAIEVPFMSTPFFTGPIAAMMGGTDITWIAGLVVGCGVYCGLAILKRNRELTSGSHPSAAHT